jgi:hypothetical protein
MAKASSSAQSAEISVFFHDGAGREAFDKCQQISFNVPGTFAFL